MGKRRLSSGHPRWCREKASAAKKRNKRRYRRIIPYQSDNIRNILSLRELLHGNINLTKFNATHDEYTHIQRIFDLKGKMSQGESSRSQNDAPEVENKSGNGEGNWDLEKNKRAGDDRISNEDGPPPQNLKYPKSVLFIVLNEFCERFSFYGMRTILAIYLKYQLDYSGDTATVIYHVFIMLCYLFPLVGAVLADSWLGKFRTIFYLSVVYAIGNVIISAAAIPDALPGREFTMVGLVLIAIGTGGIKPCVSAFGGDQFVLPQQEAQLQKFFSLFYFAINSGSLLSTFLTPILREDVKCFDQDNCFSLAFGVPAVLMIIALVVFLFGRKWYKTKKPEGNILVEVSKCIWHASTRKTNEKYEHWLYKAQDKFDRKFIDDVKATLRVLVLYIPLPIFWALFDQQGSRWTFQATRMKVDVGGGIRIKPDQMQVVNPILILLFIPLFESVVYPLFAKCHLLKRPLQRLTVGGLLAAAAFGISALVEIQLEETYPVLPQAGEGQLRLFNTLPCDLNVKISPEAGGESVELMIARMNMNASLHIPVEKGRANVKLTAKGVCLKEKEYDVVINEKKAKALAFLEDREDGISELEHESVDKSQEGHPMLMICYQEKGKFNKNITFGEKVSFSVNETTPCLDYQKLPADTYNPKVNGEDIGGKSVELQQGGMYAMLIVKEDNTYNTETITVTTPNDVSILWLIPQYVVITAGEVMFSITGLEFSFTQAPVTMKSLMQAVWLFTVAIGNLVVVIVAESKLFDSQTYEFLLFGGLMFVDMVVFALLAMRYTYVEDLKKEEKGSEIEMGAQKEEDEKM